MVHMSETIQSYRQQLTSDEIQEMVSVRPHWMVRKGNAFLGIIIVSGLALTWFIQYPDKIHASARIVAVNPPKLVCSRVDGKLQKLFVDNEQPVQKYEHLGVVENPADYYQVRSLQDWINREITITQANTYHLLKTNPLPGLDSLGELQSAFQAFQSKWQETIQTLSDGYYQHKMAALKKDMAYLASLKNGIYNKKSLLEQDRLLQNNEYKAYELLAKDKVIAPLELNQYKSKLISKDQELKQIDAEITGSHINFLNKEKELLDLNKLVADQQQAFRSSLFELKNQISQWMQQYVLVASEQGKVLFVAALQENELISTGQNLFYIQPVQTQFYAELRVSQKGLGKIRPNQKVVVRVESYPSDEYGYLTGIVKHISGIPSYNDSFVIKADLPQGLQTSYQKSIFFRNNLLAQAEVITSNRRFLERLIGRLNELMQ
jgi:multidrug resistance efflux pump